MVTGTVLYTPIHTSIILYKNYSPLYCFTGYTIKMQTNWELGLPKTYFSQTIIIQLLCFLHTYFKLFIETVPWSAVVSLSTNQFDIYECLMFIDIKEELEIIQGGIGIMDRCISFIYTGGCKLHNQIIIGVEMELVHTEHSFNTSL